MDGRTTSAQVRMENTYGLAIEYQADGNDALRFRVSAHDLIKNATITLRALPSSPDNVQVSMTAAGASSSSSSSSSWEVVDGVVIIRLGSLEFGADIQVSGLSPPESASDDNSVSSGVIVGSAVGCAALAALVGGAWYMRKPEDTGKKAHYPPGEEIHAGKQASLLQNEV
jgi:hypothetical protein